MLLNSERRITQYEHIGKWDKVLLNYDAKLNHLKDGKGINGNNNGHSSSEPLFGVLSCFVVVHNNVYFPGLVNALKHSGLVHLLNTFVCSLPSDPNDQVLSAQVECMWRLGEWGKPLPPTAKVRKNCVKESYFTPHLFAPCFFHAFFPYFS